MKLNKTILLILFTFSLPLVSGFGQEKKNEQKIKIVIAGKEGTTVMIDTTFSGTTDIDSLVTKDGTVVYLGKDDMKIQSEPGGWHKVITRVEKNGNDSDKKYIYINETSDRNEINDDKSDYVVSEDEFDNNTDNTKFVIAKNGITVTLEGKDETRVKELAGEIEKRLDVNKDENSSKQVVKEVEKKVVKKR